MNCLIVAATALEIEPFIKKLARFANPSIQIDALVAGVGLTSTSYSLTYQLSIQRPDIVIQAGISGCFDKNIALGEVFVVKQDRIADMGVMEKKKYMSVFEMGLVKSSGHPYKNGWLVNNSAVLKKTKLKKVKAVSVNTITTDPILNNYYIKNYKPVLESMEGAAVHYVCISENIPFIQLRAVSNYIGERNKKKWKLKESIENLNQELVLLLNTL
jgi:futalosine hydrolase